MKKTALVTGGNSGIGYATAKLLKEKGYAVFISGRHAERVRQAANELGVEFVIADMASLKDIKKLASYFLENGLDVLVNNAGIGKTALLSDITPNDFSEIFNINVRGPLLLIQALLPALEKCHGCITNVSSIIVTNGVPKASLYAATKGAMDAFTRSLASELASKKIRVNAVSPGLTDTPLRYKLGLTQDELDFREKLVSAVPLHRYGKPEEVAHVIWAQIESTYVTGAVWVVDGGVNAV